MRKLFNLTNPQKNIWNIDLFYGKTAANNICGTTVINQKVDFEKLNKAINLFLKSNDNFRIHFILDKNGNPKQFVNKYEEKNFHITELNDKNDLEELEKKLVNKSFDLIDNDLYRIEMFRFSNGNGGFVTVGHHLVADAWTASLVANKVINSYSSFLKDEEATLNETSYLKYVEDEAEYLKSDKFNKDKEYWNEQFKDIPAIASIPSPFESSKDSLKANRKVFKISKEDVERINEYCRENKISPFNFFMGVYAIYISRVSNQDFFTIGTPILNRTNFVEKDTPGMYISTVPVCIKMENDVKFVDFAKELAVSSLGMLRHQKYPYVNILESIRKINPEQSKLFDVMISFQNAKANRNSSDVNYDLRWAFNGYTENSLDISIADVNDYGYYDLYYDYQIEKYDDKVIEDLHSRFLEIKDQILNNREIKIEDIVILTKKELKSLENFNNTDYSYNKELTLIDLFDKQVEKTPNNVAIIYDHVEYSYRDLENIVNTIANRIFKKIGSNKKIAVIEYKSIKTVAVFLAIMKSGNCYIPIDPTYPEDRIKYILDNSYSDLVICDKEIANDYENPMIIDNINVGKRSKFTSLANPEGLAYMIYTSGSTGKPKGIGIKHSNIINTLIWRKNYYKFNEEIVSLQIPSFSFDSSVEDIYTPLISGSKLVIPSFSKMDVNKICEYIKKYGVNHFLVVPSIYKILLEEKSKYLKKFNSITIAGESFNENLVVEHFEKLPNVKFINEYGPTENSVCSTFYEFTKEKTKVFIGEPINNCKCYVLDDKQNLLPPNTPGELYLSGIGLSDGYFNNPKMTSERFIFSPRFEEVLYKTGDIARWNVENGLEFLGRNDNQIKFHGFRIELQGITNLILKYKGIKDCVTVLRKSNSSNNIYSYIIVKDKDREKFDLKELYSFVKQNLTYYMVPEIVLIDEFPHTPNGKIDIKKLPMKVISNKKKHKKAETKTEKEILKVTREVLNSDEIYVDDNIFDIGMADSLSILTITSKLYSRGISIPTQSFYKYFTIEKIAKSLDQIDSIVTEKDGISKIKDKTDINNYDFSDLDFRFKNVFLTGATGFLGIHILRELIKKQGISINCIIRKKENFSPYDRLKKVYEYYFGQKDINLFIKKVRVFEGDLSLDNFGLEKDDIEELSKCDNVIHTAALTKHYGNNELFYKANVVSTKNIIDFCLKYDILLNYMSTTSISGDLEEENQELEFDENSFYIGQNYKNNIYISSKFEAENLIFKEQYNGLKANIYRLGNLMGRYGDGVFQSNKYDNAFYMKLLVVSKLGEMPKEFKNLRIDFSPIDKVADAIIRLMEINNLSNCVFHISNLKSISIDELISIFKEYDFKFKYVNEDKFLEDLKNNSRLMKYFISDISSNISIIPKVNICNDITMEFLNKVGFNWGKIDKRYISKFIEKTNLKNDLKSQIII